MRLSNGALYAKLSNTKAGFVLDIGWLYLYVEYTAEVPSEIQLFISDGFLIGDTSLESMSAGVVLTDGLKTGDSSSGLGQFQSLRSDGVKVGDSLLSALISNLALSDGIKAGDLAQLLASTMQVVSSDGVKVSDISSILLIRLSDRYRISPQETWIGDISKLGRYGSKS